MPWALWGPVRIFGKENGGKLAPTSEPKTMLALSRKYQRNASPLAPNLGSEGPSREAKSINHRSENVLNTDWFWDCFFVDWIDFGCFLASKIDHNGYQIRSRILRIILTFCNIFANGRVFARASFGLYICIYFVTEQTYINTRLLKSTEHTFIF